MATAPFPVQPELTAIAITYRNRKLIADDVLPRVPVGKQEFKYLKHNLAEGFTIPQTAVGRKGKPGEVEFSATEVTDSAVNHALDDPVPQDDIDNAPPNYDPVGRAVEGVTDLIYLAREKRAADLVFTAANYPSGLKTQLSSTSLLSDFTNSDPVGVLTTATEAPIMRPNICVMGRAVWAKIRLHPKLVSAILGPNASDGIISKEQFRELLELDELLIGEGWLNTAKPGQTATLARVWGKHIAFHYRDKLAATQNGRATFGLTAQWRQIQAGAKPDDSIGAFGGQRVRVAESVKELITASDLGYFIEDAIA